MEIIMSDEELARAAQRFYESASEHGEDIIFTSMLAKPAIIEALQAAISGEVQLVRAEAQYKYAVENRVVKAPPIALFRDRKEAEEYSDQFIDLRVIPAPATPEEPTFEQCDALARKFHEAYERLAPSYGYKTRKESAVPWADVPSGNKDLMRAVAREILVGTDITK